MLSPDSFTHIFFDYLSGDILIEFSLGLIVLIIILIIFKRIKKGDSLKYEFITTVSHKFRTPLTGIKWATENLNAMTLPEDALEQVGYIKGATDKLVELTDLLINTASAENQSYRYNPIKVNLSNEVVHVIDSLSRQIHSKKTNLVKNIEHDLHVICDIARIRFVMQSLIENAIHYTRENGIILVKIQKIKDAAVFSVQDKGIGIDKAEIPLIFEKFYRTSEARTLDTEGMGIGLFISKEIIKHHKGKIWVESDGIDKGSTFYFSLPIKK